MSVLRGFCLSLQGLAILCLLGASMNANAQAGLFERLVTPGPLIADHAEYEDECGSCHENFSRGSQRSLCLDCHTEIALDVESVAGFHGLSPDVGEQECAEQCNSD